jgi:two-component system, OmpR family, phosphate regulon sensor histidine kinase PhoR
MNKRSNRLFWKVFAVYMVISLVTVGVVVSVVAARQADRMTRDIEQRLESQTVLLRELLRPALTDVERFESIQQQVKNWANEIDIRITLVRPDGVVVADSHDDASRMENHATRPEIAQVLTTDGTGTIIRQSPTVGSPMLYVARAIFDGGKRIGAVRVAVPLDALRQEQRAVRNLTVYVGLGVCAVGLLLTYWIVGRIARPIRSLTRAAQAITAGDYNYQLKLPTQDEFQVLAEAFAHMTRELSRRIDETLRYGDQLATVLGGMEEGVVAINKQHRVLFANRAARRLLEISTEDVVQRPLWELIRHPQIQKAVADSLQGGPDRTELELGGPERRVLSLHITPLPGKPSSGLVLVFHDVTELRRLERLRQEFVANVSHELKTPLTSIKAYAETLREGAIHDPEHNLRFVHRIEQQSERLNELILDLLSLARIESGQQPFEIVSVPLDERLGEWVNLHSAAAEAKGVQLNLIPDTQPRAAVADEEGLRQIVDNLLDNAIKYTPEGGNVTVRWFADGDAVVIEVQDTGIGIARADQERIFERFYRVDKARSRELGGTGLGLSIVKHLALSFGGNVSVRSQQGHGSTFIVRLKKG